MSVRAVQRRAGVRVGWVPGIALTLLATCVTAIADRQEIDLSEASVISDRGDWGYHVVAQSQMDGWAQGNNVIDGDDETGWSNGNLPLPANLFMVFAEPVVAGGMEVVTTIDGAARVRLTDLEIYARVGDGWALLGEVNGNDQTVMDFDLIPAEVTMLRIRVLSNERPDNKWAQVRSVRLFAAEADAAPVTLQPEEVASEASNEQVFAREALGLRGREPRITYDPEKGYLGYVTAFLDTMIEHGTDRYGEVHSPMFVGLLEVDTHEHPGGYIPSIPGQRWYDRPIWGGNLGHDRPLLEAMQYVSDLTGDDRYRDAAQAYLQFFLDNCTDTPTGLWPWGEHVYWDFYRDRYSQDNHNHELEGYESMSFWETAWEMNSQAVLGLAGGLINHVKCLDTFAFCRHADIRHVLPTPRIEEPRVLDFQSYGGLWMRIWAFAWSKSGDETYYGWIERMADYFEVCRLEESGMLPVLSQHAWRPLLNPNPGGTLAVGLSMLEASELLDGTPLGERLRQLGGDYLETVAAAEPVEPPPAAGLRVVHRTASGNRAVSYWEEHGGWLDLQFDLPDEGAYIITLRYALEHDDTRRVVLIDGEEVGEFDLPGTGDWFTFETAIAPLEPLNLLAGEVVLRLLNRESVGLALDWVALHGEDGTPYVLVEAEDFLEIGGVELPPPPENEKAEVGFDSGYGGVSNLRRQIPDRPITGFVGNHRQMLAYRVTGDERHLEAARQVAEAYAAIEEVPDYDHLRANVFGRLIHMMLDMYEFDPDERWLEAAEMYGRAGIEGLYSNGLFRGATNQWIYDSHLYVSTFVHGLVRLHTVTEQEELQTPPLYY